MIGGPFALPPGPPELRDLCLRIARSEVEGIAERTAALLRQGLPARDLVRAIAITAAQVVDFEIVAPGLRHGTMALAAATAVAELIPPDGEWVLPYAQAVRYLAMERKRALPLQPPTQPGPADPAALEAAIRNGETAAADAACTALIAAGADPMVLVDALMLPALEDLSAHGHKSIFAVEAWHLAAYLSWEHAATILRPAVRYVAGPGKSSSEFRRAAQLLSARGLEPAALVAQRGELTDGQRLALLEGLRTGAGPALNAVVDVMAEGVGPAAIFEVIAVAAARSLLHTDPTAWWGPVHAVDLTWANQWIYDQARLPSRIFAVLQSAVAVGRQPGGNPYYPRIAPIENGLHANETVDAILAALRRRIAVRDVAGAATLVETALHRGASVADLLGTLAVAAAQDDLDMSAGHHFKIVQATRAAVAQATAADQLTHLQALAKYLTGFEKRRAVSEEIMRYA